MSIVEVIKDTKLILDSLPDMVAVLDKQHNIVFANQAMSSKLGIRPEELIGRKCYECVHGTDQSPGFCPHSMLLKDGKNHEIEMQENRLGGYCHVICSPIRDENGEVIGSSHSVKNIDDLKITEKKLRDSESRFRELFENSKLSEDQIKASEEKYRALFNSLSDAIFIHDMEGCFLAVNDAAVERLEYNREELLNMAPKDINAPEYAKRIPDRIKQLMNKGQAFFETIHIAKDGREIPTEINSKVINYNGKPAILSIARDITERKKVEEDLRRSEERYRGLFNDVPIGLYRTSPSGQILDANIADVNLLGYPDRDTFLATDANDLYVDPDVRDQKLSEINSKGVLDSELQLRRYDGLHIWVHDVSKVIKDDQGNALYYDGILEDITERKQSERLLRENEEKYRVLVESLPNVIMRFDRDARHLFVSNSVVKDTGMMPDKFIGKTHRELGYPDELCKYWEQSISRVINTGKVCEDDFEFEGINGAVIYNRRLVPEIDEHGNVRTVLSIAHDITEFRKSEKNYQSIFNSMINGFAFHEIICDESGKPVDYRFLNVNPAFERLTGLSRESVIGNTALKVLPNLEPYWIDIYGEVALTGEPAHFENYSQDLDRYFEVTAYSSRKNQFATIFNDITDRKRSEDLQIKLQQTSKLESIGQLAGGIAHDFNNMLTVIQGSTSLAMIGLNRNDPLFNRLKMIEEASNRAGELTRQLLAFSRKQIIELKIINLNDVIMNLQKMLGRLIGEDIELKIFLNKNLANMNADTGQIEQIIINLVVNSRDAMPQGGKLTVETSNVFLDKNYCRKHPNVQVGNYIQMTISDTGHGMSEKTKQHIFEPFFTTKKLGDGTGLGLATVYGIVKQHNGYIECYSELGHGTTFRIYLPHADEDKTAELKESEDTGIILGSETILLVEDEDIVRDMTADFLKHLGYNVLIAENGGTGLIIAEQYSKIIHLLMTDVVMPVINGRQLAERLLNIHPEMKVLYTSGYTQNVIEEHGILEEGINFISKPYRLQALANKLKNVLKGK